MVIKEVSLLWKFAGQVCTCSKGRMGLVTDVKELDWGWTCVGIGLDGKGAWSSRNPQVVFETLEQYIRSIINQEKLSRRVIRTKKLGSPYEPAKTEKK